MQSKTRFFVQSDGHKTAYQVIEGEESDSNCQALPLIVVNGLKSVKEDYLEFAVLLATHRKVLILDNRGMGESSVPTSPFTIPTMAADVLALATHLHFPKFDIMGFSMGGLIVQTLCLQHPNSVRRAVLGCTMFDPAKGSTPEFLAAAAFAAKQSNPNARDIQMETFRLAYSTSRDDELEHLLDQYLSRMRPVEGFKGQLAACAAFKPDEAAMRSIVNKVLIVHAKDDRMVPYQNARELASLISGAKILILEQGGHRFWTDPTVIDSCVYEIHSFLTDD